MGAIICTNACAMRTADGYCRLSTCIYPETYGRPLPIIHGDGGFSNKAAAEQFWHDQWKKWEDERARRLQEGR